MVRVRQQESWHCIGECSRETSCFSASRFSRARPSRSASRSASIFVQQRIPSCRDGHRLVTRRCDRISQNQRFTNDFHTGVNVFTAVRFACGVTFRGGAKPINLSKYLAEGEGFGLDSLSPLNVLRAFYVVRTRENVRNLSYRYKTGNSARGCARSWKRRWLAPGRSQRRKSLEENGDPRLVGGVGEQEAW